MKLVDPNSLARCSFCGHSADDVSRMVTENGIFICDDCVSLCLDIVSQEPSASRSKVQNIQEMYPKEIKRYLDQHIIGQDHAKKALSVAVYNHYKRIRSDAFDFDSSDPDAEVELSKGNVLLIGPTGSGKTLMAKTLAKKLDVPFTMADATSLTEAGYVGEDVENIIKNLWIAADRNTEAAKKGIVCIDEVDKLGTRNTASSSSRDVGGEGVQQALLKMVEASEVLISPEGSRNRPQQEFIHIDTRDILFICCGSFEGLSDLIAKRLGESRMGFGSENVAKKTADNQTLRHVQPKDLYQFGLIPEFVGRFPIIVTFDTLDEDQLVKILWSPKNSLVAQYQKLFELEGVELRFEQDALKAMVQKAIARNTGARGLRTIIEDVMLDIMYEIPSLANVSECVVTEACVVQQERPTLIFNKKTA